MATQVQRRRGTAAQTSTFTGAAGEVTVDTTNNRPVVHDGSTAGGHPVPGWTDQQKGTFVYGTATGTDTITTTLSPAPAAYTAGMEIRLKIASNNTTAVTVNANSLGAVTVKKTSGGSLVDLEADDFVSGSVAKLLYNGTYLIFSGIAGGTSPLVLIERKVISSSTSNVDFTTGITSDYDGLRLIANNIDQSTDANLFLRFSNNGGSSFSSSGAYSYYGNKADMIAATTDTHDGAGQSRFVILPDHEPSGLKGWLDMTMNQPDDASQFPRISWEGVYRKSNGNAHEITARGVYTNTLGYDAFRLSVDSGTIDGGTFALYGLRNS